ncbi:MAG: hypothetical protein AAB937_00860 [Patescibacteria group bacterium]
MGNLRRFENFQPEDITPENAFSFIHDETFIDQGVDSDAFHWGDSCIQRFHDQHPEKIRLLQRVARKAAEIANGRTARIGLHGQVTFKFVEIDKVVIPKRTPQPFTVKEYQGGRRPKEGQIKPLDRALKALSIDLNQQIGVEGIAIIAPNTKLQKTNRGIGPFAKYICAVTDPCQYVDDLRKKK